MAKARSKAKKREDGRYQSKLRTGIDENGKPITKYFYSYISKADADRQRAAYVLAHPFQDMTALKSCYTLRQWCDKWQSSYKGALAANTKAGYASACNHICSFEGLGSMDLADIKPIHVSKYMNSLVGTSKSNIKLKRSVLSSLFETAVDNEIIKSNPVRKLREKIRGTYKGHRALTRREINLITDYYAGHRGGLLMMLMLWAGLRREEALGLRWRDIDFDEKLLHVSEALDVQHKARKTTKTEAGVRTVPLFLPLYNALLLSKPVEVASDAPVCTSAAGKEYTMSAFKRVMDSYMLYMERILNCIAEPEHPSGWRRDLAMKKFEEDKKVWQTFKFTAHDLRYTFATLCFDAGVDVQTTKTWMGHEDIETTLRIYTKLSSERQLQSETAMHNFAQSFCERSEPASSDTLLTPLQ